MDAAGPAAAGEAGTARLDALADASLVTDSKRITSILGPVFAAMALTCAYTSALGLGVHANGLFATALPYDDNGRDPLGPTLAGAALNATIFTGGAILLTCVFVLLFYWRMRRAILVLLVSAYAIFFAALCTLVLLRASQWIPLDWITFALLILNATAVFLVATFVETRGTPHQAALVLHAASLTLPFLYCGDATVWCTLAFIVVWDVLAVMTPCGPLRWAMLLDEHRTRTGDPFPLPAGLVYEGYLYRLGTGDMVFFAVLIGRAWVSGWVEFVTCWTGTVAGVGVTVMATVLTRHHTLPALPVSLILGTAAYWYARLVLHGYIRDHGLLFY